MKFKSAKKWLRRGCAALLTAALSLAAVPAFASVTGSSSSYVSGTTYTHNSKFAGYSVVNGIDVSSYQYTNDWEKIKADGIDFAFVRVAYRGYGSSGSLNPDGKYQQNLTNAIAAGVKVGVYIYSQAITVEEGIEEANYILEKIKGYDVTLPVVIDYEYAGTGVGRLYNANLTRREATDICAAFCDTVAAAGYTPMVYANKSMFETKLYASELSAKYQIWLANYTSKTSYSGDYQYWQYSSSGSVNGVGSKSVDCNFFYTTDSSYQNIQIDRQTVTPSAIDASFTIGVQNPGGGIVSEVGFKLYNASGSLIGTYSDKASLSSSYVTYTNSLSSYSVALTPLTSYRYLPYAVVGGKTYYGSIKTFTTTEPKVDISSSVTPSEHSALLTVTLDNPAKTTVTGLTCKLYDTSGNLLKSYTQAHSSADQKQVIAIDVSSQMGQYLSSGTTYQYEISVSHDNKTETSEKKSFTTSGTMVLNSITLDQTSLTLGVGGTATLTATLNPTDYNGTVTFTSTNSNVVKVDSSGNLTAKAVGTCTITASAGGKTASCVVTVTNSVTAISLEESEIELPAGEITLLTANTTPAGLSYSALSWSSSNPSVATVNEYGVVVGVRAGDAIITCRASNNYNISASCLVTVKNSINYQLDGGTNSAENPEFCEADETVTLQDPEKKGYEFAGWYADADFTTPVTEITADSTGTATVYAKWSKISVSKPSIKKLYTKVSGKLYVYLTGTVEGADGYQYVYATKSDFSDKKTSSVAGTTRGLNVSLNTKYYVKVRAYRIDSSGARVYSGYSSVFSATTASVKADNLTGIKVSSSSGKLTIAVAAPVASSYGYQYAYSTSSSFSKTTYVTTRSRSCTVSSLPKGTYYVRARTTYLDPVTGGYTYGLYTTTTKITIK